MSFSITNAQTVASASPDHEVRLVYDTREKSGSIYRVTRLLSNSRAEWNSVRKAPPEKAVLIGKATLLEQVDRKEIKQKKLDDAGIVRYPALRRLQKASPNLQKPTGYSDQKLIASCQQAEKQMAKTRGLLHDLNQGREALRTEQAKAERGFKRVDQKLAPLEKLIEELLN